MLRSWPLPARRTTSPGRARANAARIAASRSATRRRSSPRRRPAASAPAAICSRIATRVLAARILVGRDHEAAALAGHATLDRPLRDVALARRPEDRDRARRRGPTSGASASSAVASEAGVWA